MSLISSRNNSNVKLARSLRQRKARQETGLFLVEGIRLVGEAAELAANIETILYAPEILNSQFAEELLKAQERAGVKCLAVTPDVYQTISDKENPQGILAVVHQTYTGLETRSPENFPWGVALVAPQDPGNLGTILRTIDSVGASGLLLLDSAVDPYHPNAVRASMGSIFGVPLVSATFVEFSAWAKQGGYTIYGTSAHADQDYRQVGKFETPRILLMGSERQGLTQEQIAICDQMLVLPMRGRATSLNLAVATGVMLYAMLEG